MGDGLAVLTGTIKGNEDDDTITLANADGGFVQGNSGDDTITLGFGDGFGTAAGSRAAASINNASINGSGGDDTINITSDVALTDSTVRGNEGDDTITAEAGAIASGSVAIEGNAGDDTLNVADIEGGATIRGGSGDDTLRVGNGQVVYGGKGADTFSIEAAGGVTIMDYDRLDLTYEEFKPTGEYYGEYGEWNGTKGEDGFCDDQIQIDGHKIFHTTYNYGVSVDKYTSASSWTGDVKVKAVLDQTALDAGTATASIIDTKTQTITAMAVANIYISQTETGFFTLPEVQYAQTGVTEDGSTFLNGLRNLTGSSNNNTYATPGDAMLGRGEGQGYAKATGYWTSNQTISSGLARQIQGQVRTIIAQTNTAFQKGDFSFLGLTDTAKVGVTSKQVLVYNDITQATIKNHWASYNKVKSSADANLYDQNFGTAAFDTITTGKVYQIVQDLEDKTYKTETLGTAAVGATTTVSVDLKHTFKAWKVNYNETGTVTGETQNETFTSESGEYTKISIDSGAKLFAPVVKTTSEGGTTSFSASNRFQTSNGKAAWFTGLTSTSLGQSYYSAIVTLGSNSTTGYFTVSGSSWYGYSSSFLSSTSTSGTLLTAQELLWSTVMARGLFTLTTTAILPASAGTSEAGPYGSNNNSDGATYTLIRGVDNTNRTVNLFDTGSGKLGIKIAVSETETVKATEAISSIVARTTITGTTFDISKLLPFPGTGEVIDGIGDTITGDVNQKYVWTGSNNNLQSRLGIGYGYTEQIGAIYAPYGEFGYWAESHTFRAETPDGRTGLKATNSSFWYSGSGSTQFYVPIFEKTIITSNYDTHNASALTVLNFGTTSEGNTNNGFFSASSFNTTNLAAEGFGQGAVRKIADIESIATSDVTAGYVPFRVLFFDNDATDNGLYVYSGVADYKSGELTAINTNPTASSAIGGKHTIVKVDDGKGQPISLTDINLV
uniref:hypothetical protein n=1 Tax=Synechococcus sp. UW106 TaxID=368495 RepID=UPI001A7E04EA|nr:hypothetical protein [Synechococcus sp. UW106]